MLSQKMESLDAIAGRAIVIEVQTGEVKASVGNDSILQESGLTRAATLLLSLETGKVKLSDRVDVGNGELFIATDTLRDHNWRRGGYGELTVKQSFGVASNIASYLIVKNTFGNGVDFAKALGRYGSFAFSSNILRLLIIFIHNLNIFEKKTVPLYSNIHYI